MVSLHGAGVSTLFNTVAPPTAFTYLSRLPALPAPMLALSNSGALEPPARRGQTPARQRSSKELKGMLDGLTKTVAGGFGLKCILIIIVFAIVLGYELPRVAQAMSFTLAMHAERLSVLDMDSALRSRYVTQDSSFLDRYQTGVQALRTAESDMLRLAPNLITQDQLHSALQATQAWMETWVAHATLANLGTPNDTVSFFQRGDVLLAHQKDVFNQLNTALMNTRTHAVDDVMRLLLALAVLLLVSTTAVGTWITLMAMRISKKTTTGVQALQDRINDIAVGKLEPVSFDNEGMPTELAKMGAGLNQLALTLRSEMQAQQAAEEASRSKSAFLGHMSHELRTPMNSVIGLTGLLLLTTLTLEQRDLLKIIQSSGEALMGLLTNILDWCKIESGALELDTRPFDLYQSLMTIVHQHQDLGFSKGVELIVNYDHNCPSVIRGDANRLQQVLSNLVSNAVKFTERGSVVVETQLLKTLTSSAEVRFIVRDSGIGIPRQRFGRLFKSFSQGDSSTTSVYGGTGLGLAISQRLVQAMGGRISVESQVGRGSQFQFDVWLSIDNTAGIAGSGSNNTSLPLLCPQLAGKRVLAIDGNPVNLRIVQRELEGRQGMVCTVEDNPMTALAGVLQNGRQFDVAIVDQNAPGIKGTELLERLRAAGPVTNTMSAVLLLPPKEAPPPSTLASGGGLRVVAMIKPITETALVEAVSVALSSAPLPASDTAPRLPLAVASNSSSTSASSTSASSTSASSTSASSACTSARAGTGSSTGSSTSSTRSTSSTSSTSSSTAATQTPGPSTGVPRVLLVEDNPNNQMVARLLLSKLGITGANVAVAADGQMAVTKATADRAAYDWVLMDVRLPVMDGMMATKQIRSRLQRAGRVQPWITAMTASALPEDKRACLDSGMNDYLSKPVTVQQLQEAYERYNRRSVEVPHTHHTAPPS
jgi:signal transduction histidine kinase/CheY-like chemotaxis protein